MAPMIPPVPFDTLLKAYLRVAADRTARRPPAPSVSIVMALRDHCGRAEIIAVQQRLTALSHTATERDVGHWVLRAKGKAFTLVSGALLRAAATAPLQEPRTANDLRFVPEDLLDITLRGVEPDDAA